MTTNIQPFIIALLTSCLFALFLSYPAEGYDFSLSSVPATSQDQTNWCWAASVQAELKYYGIVQRQCDIANLAWGRSDCCVTPSSSSCNLGNKNGGTLPNGGKNVPSVLANWGVYGNGMTRALTQTECVTEINAGRPFIIGIIDNNDSNNGHDVVGYGYEQDGKYIWLMDTDVGDFERDLYTEMITNYDKISNLNWKETVQITTNPRPACETGFISNTSFNGATMKGTVNANNYSTVVTFEYGTSTSYGTSVTADQSPVSGSGATTVSATITGLASSTVYHFRVKATNANGTSYSSDGTFTTSIGPINGVCGSDNGQALISEPTTNRCAVGSPTDFTGVFPPWNWTCTGSNGGSTASCSATLAKFNFTINAVGGLLTFELPGYSPSTRHCGGTCNYTLWAGQQITFTATTPNSGNKFNGWSGACTGTGACSINLEGNNSVTATFTQNTETINVGSSGNGTVSPAGPVTLTYGSSQTFNIQASSGSHIIDVRVDGVSVGAVSSYTFTNISANHTIFAFFSSPTCIPYPDGDVNGDGKAMAVDALLALRAAVGLDPITPQIFAHGDVAPLGSNGYPAPDGQITAADALVILQKAVGLVNWNSSSCETQTAAVVPMTTINPLSGTSTPSLSLIPSGNGSYTIQGTNMDGVASIQMTIAYDTSTLSSPNVTLGSLASGATLGVNTTSNPGLITIGIISITPFSGSGPIAVINFATWNAASAVPLLTYSLSDSNGSLIATSSGATTPYYMVTGTVAGGNGTISPVSANQSYNSFVGITISPNTGYYLASLTDNGTNVTSSLEDNVYWLLNITGPHNIIATFAQNASPPAPVPALGPWSMLIAVAGMGMLMRRKKPKKDR